MNSKISYLTYEIDMMGSLGIEPVIVDLLEGLEPVLKTLVERGIYIVYVSEAVYHDHQKIINQYQLGADINICVMGARGAQRMLEFTHQTLGLNTKKEGSH